MGFMSMNGKVKASLYKLDNQELDKLYIKTQNRINKLEGFKQSDDPTPKKGAEDKYLESKAGYHWSKCDHKGRYHEETHEDRNFANKIAGIFVGNFAVAAILFSQDFMYRAPIRPDEIIDKTFGERMGWAAGGGIMTGTLMSLAYAPISRLIEKAAVETKLANNKERLAILQEEYENREIGNPVSRMIEAGPSGGISPPAPSLA